MANLEARAEKGDARAEFGLSILYQYGLQGKSVNSLSASQWRGKALNARSTTPITQYVPGINSKPGRTVIVNVAESKIPADEVLATDNCLVALAAMLPDTQIAVKCGGISNAQNLIKLWDQAK